MSDEHFKQVDTKRARRQYINAISTNRVEAPEVGLLYRLRRWPLANAFVLASLIVPPALFQYSQNAGANPAQHLATNHLVALNELELAALTSADCDAEDIASFTVPKSAKQSPVVTSLPVTATVVTTPSPVLAEVQDLTQVQDQELAPTQAAEAQMLVVVYSTLSQVAAIDHANELADIGWIQEPARPRVVQSDSGYYGVVFGQYKPSKAQQMRRSAVQAGVAKDAYLMNQKRVERWIES